ncbi:uncharacterized protein LOC128194004 [Vigna angularis]|uniref:uncharacterized protein LOC128194004 n=1 Tax=Phaseolus angularis TaxID=3914 RepID=UPI0022B4D06B|nr:uncharacterized protein LOC128194004 [Vigna angularis]
MRSGGRNRGLVFERLAATKQMGTVDEFVQEFEVLAGQTKGFPNEQLLGYFLASLQEDMEETDASMDQRQMELSSFSAGGLTQPKKMKLQGEIKGRIVLVLIDNGTSHKFILQGVVEELSLEVEATRRYHVSLGDGQKRRTQGLCRGVILKIGKVEVEERFYLFELGGV